MSLVHTKSPNDIMGRKQQNLSYGVSPLTGLPRGPSNGFLNEAVPTSKNPEEPSIPPSENDPDSNSLLSDLSIHNDMASVATANHDAEEKRNESTQNEIKPTALDYNIGEEKKEENDYPVVQTNYEEEKKDAKAKTEDDDKVSVGNTVGQKKNETIENTETQIPLEYSAEEEKEEEDVDFVAQKETGPAAPEIDTEEKLDIVHVPVPHGTVSVTQGTMSIPVEAEAKLRTRAVLTIQLSWREYSSEKKAFAEALARTQRCVFAAGLVIFAHLWFHTWIYAIAI